MIVRAAATGLLSTDDGCPPTSKYLVRETLTIAEIRRAEHVDAARAAIFMSAAQAQVLFRRKDEIPDYRLFTNAVGAAGLQYVRMLSLLSPWDESLRSKVQELESERYNRENALPGLNMSEEQLLEYLKDFEQTKQRFNRKPDEPDRSTGP